MRTFTRNLKNNILNQKGFTLIELSLAMIGVAILGVGIKVIGDLSKKTTQKFTTSIGSQVGSGKVNTATILSIKEKMLDLMTSELAWQNTFYDVATSIPGFNTTSAFYCLGSGSCTIGTSIAFRLRDKTGAVYYDGTNLNLGFSENGAVCTSNCTFRYNLTWTSLCLSTTPALSTSTLVSCPKTEKVWVQGSLVLRSGVVVQDLLGSVNQFNFEIFPRNLTLSTGPTNPNLLVMPANSNLDATDFAIDNNGYGVAVGTVSEYNNLTALTNVSAAIQCFKFNGTTKINTGFIKIADSGPGTAGNTVGNPQLSKLPYVAMIKSGASSLTHSTAVLYGKLNSGLQDVYIQRIDPITCSCDITKANCQHISTGLKTSDSFKDLKIDNTGNIYLWTIHASAPQTYNFRKFLTDNSSSSALSLSAPISSATGGVHIALNRVSGSGMISYESQNGAIWAKRFASSSWIDSTFVQMITTGLGSWYDSHSIEINDLDDFIMLWEETQSHSVKLKTTNSIFTKTSADIRAVPEVTYKSGLNADFDLFRSTHSIFPFQTRDRSWIIPSILQTNASQFNGLTKVCTDGRIFASSLAFSPAEGISYNAGGWMLRIDDSNLPAFYRKLSGGISKNTFFGAAGTIGKELFDGTVDCTNWTIAPQAQVDGNLKSFAMSQNGQTMIAAYVGSRLQVSTDRGRTWSTKSIGNTPSSRDWRSVAISGDGVTMAAGSLDYTSGTNSGGLFVSRDAGVTWTKHLTYGWWPAIAISKNGNVIVATDGVSHYRSLNAGTFTQLTPPISTGGTRFSQLKISDDGTKVFTAPDQNSIYYLSTDSGASYVTKSCALGPNQGLKWGSCPINVSSASMSGDGNVITVSTAWQYVLISKDAGLTWTKIQNIPNAGWGNIAISADKNTILLNQYANPNNPSTASVLQSTDQGLSWIEQSTITPLFSPLKIWVGLQVSSDGKILSGATANNGTELGKIFIRP